MFINMQCLRVVHTSKHHNIAQQINQVHHDNQWDQVHQQTQLISRSFILTLQYCSAKTSSTPWQSLGSSSSTYTAYKSFNHLNNTILLCKTIKHTLTITRIMFINIHMLQIVHLHLNIIIYEEHLLEPDLNSLTLLIVTLLTDYWLNPLTILTTPAPS